MAGVDTLAARWAEVELNVLSHQPAPTRKLMREMFYGGAACVLTMLRQSHDGIATLGAINEELKREFGLTS